MQKLLNQLGAEDFLLEGDSRGLEKRREEKWEERRMAEEIGLIKEIESLKRSQLEERHALGDELAELKRSVHALEGTILTMRNDVEKGRLAASSAGLTSADVRRELVNCLSSPESPVCQRVRIEAEQAASAALARRDADVAEEEGAQGVRHETADEYLKCPECRERFIRASKVVPEFEDAILAGIAERDAEKLIANLQKQGYKVEKKEAKAKDWLTGV